MERRKLIYRLPAATMGLVLMAAGCSVGPNYQKPDLPVPAAWTEAQQKGVDARSAELARWWSTFDDPLLNSLVERAVRSNLRPAFGGSPYPRGPRVTSRNRFRRLADAECVRFVHAQSRQSERRSSAW